jgi:fatty-acyl-CoA synthase
MRFPLTLMAILRRAETLFGRREIVSYEGTGEPFRYGQAAMFRRAKKLALALRALGVRAGDRVATLAWNHHRHLEAFWGIVACGGVLHALNARLHPDELAYVIRHADDRAILVDVELLPLLEQVRAQIDMSPIIVLADAYLGPEPFLSYEALLAHQDEREFTEPELGEWDAAALCYTSGTTGRPKGVLHAHRAIVLQSWAWMMTDVFGISTNDVLMPVVPMFHINCWETPFTAALAGAKLVLCRPQLDFPSLARRIQDEKVTVAAGITTIWIGLLDYLERNPGHYDLSSLRSILIGGAPVPQSMIERYAEDHGVQVKQSWGMTETAPLGTIPVLTEELQAAPRSEQYQYLSRPGFAAPFIELRVRDEQGIVAWDGQRMGELEVRGPWVAGAYFNCPDSAERFTPDGWFRTGDIVTIDQRGCIDLRDRRNDLIKSGGEWISSVALENALMGHPAVLEAAVIAVPHPRWIERPLAVVVPRNGQMVTADELLQFIAPRFVRWWLPDAVEFVDHLPHTPTGKFLKRALREQFRAYRFPGT